MSRLRRRTRPAAVAVVPPQATEIGGEIISTELAEEAVAVPGDQTRR